MLSIFNEIIFAESIMTSFKKNKMSLHETQINKTRKIAGYTISILASLMILGAGVSKIMGSEEIVKTMNRLPNFGNKIFIIGVLELFILALYWIPKTSNLGFFLLCSFGGGAIAAEIVLGDTPIGGIMFSILLYVGTKLRKPSLSGLGI